MKQPISMKKIATTYLFPFGAAASCFFGISLHTGLRGGAFMASVFKAFTIQSNIWVGVLALIGIAGSLLERAGRTLPSWLGILRFMFTTSILLTWSVFAVLLTPKMDLAYLLSLSNLFLHNLTPVFGVLTYINQPDTGLTKKKHLWTVVIMPLLYGIYFLTEYAVTEILPVGYFFLDYRKSGWFSFRRKRIGVVYWIGFLLTALVGIGAALFPLKAATKKRPLRTSFLTAAVMIGISSSMVVLRAIALSGKLEEA